MRGSALPVTPSLEKLSLGALATTSDNRKRLPTHFPESCLGNIGIPRIRPGGKDLPTPDNSSIQLAIRIIKHLKGDSDSVPFKLHQGAFFLYPDHSRQVIPSLGTNLFIPQISYIVNLVNSVRTTLLF